MLQTRFFKHLTDLDVIDCRYRSIVAKLMVMQIQIYCCEASGTADTDLLLRSY
jgi:hypothetical protein